MIRYAARSDMLADTASLVAAMCAATARPVMLPLEAGFCESMLAEKDEESLHVRDADGNDVCEVILIYRGGVECLPRIFVWA